MISRNKLSEYLQHLFRYEDYDDHCQNGLQIEGSGSISKIAFAVSYNRLSVDEAVRWGADALIVHHGIFGKDFFTLRGREKVKVKKLLDADMSLFGIHLPLDAHCELGNNAQLAACISAEIIETVEVGFVLRNTAKLRLDEIIARYHEKLGTDTGIEIDPSGIMPGKKFGIDYLAFGPQTPKTLACVSGGGAAYYEKALAMGVDTYITGDIREQIPAIAYETKTNYLNIGHYWSETLGIKALKAHLENKFELETRYFNINNRI
ncbi:MAG: Nif3-like dinuclear metal center hexameric protein [Candidatus Marinimicrobia bacterium]|nr:Nif3-like dinuclear metal center hexameric protein [Candidatus Neomarinimicrobiota bacterium]